MKITVQIKPNSRKGPLVVEQGGDYVVYLREKPVEGEANTALVKLLAKHFGVARSQVTIVRGAKSRTKQVEIIL